MLLTSFALIFHSPYPPGVQERSKEHREQGSCHSFGAGKVGALAAGVAAIGAVYHGHDKHKKERAEDEVSFMLHTF
jgi:hypothetical protein